MRLKYLNSLLLACKDKTAIAKIHALIMVTGHSSHGEAVSKLAASYARMGHMTNARHVFENSPLRRVDLWNAMIIAYSRREYPTEVLSLYHRMIAEGVRPDSSTFTVTLKACASLRDVKMGEEIWHRAVDYGYEFDVFVGTSVLNLYVRCGKMDEAMLMFEKIPRRDLVCWTSMVTGFAQSGQPREAIDVFRRMLKEGNDVDGVVMVGLIQACADLGDMKLGISIHGYMIRRDTPLDVLLQTTLVDMYAKNGRLEIASCVFKRMPNRNSISWAALMSGFAQNGFAVDALELLVEMQSCGIEPDLVSLVSALSACSQVGFLKLGKSVHGYMVRRLVIDPVSGSAMIDMYSKCGVLSCARSLFDQIDTRDSISWNTMITSYGIHGYGMEALSLFHEMTQTNSKPDHATFAALLSAFSHSGLVEEGQYWFDRMVNEYKIQPNEKHYACMVDLLARAGQVKEAYQLAVSLKSKAGLAIWVALLSGCHNYGKLLIGEMAAKKILELNPDDLGIYALVSNFFSMAVKWDKVAVLRKIMKGTGMKKVPGYSLVEVDGKQHTFLMEDKSHHQYEGIRQILDSLDKEMKAIKYVLNIEFVFLDHEERKFVV